jgi:hypothetical protein
MEKLRVVKLTKKIGEMEAPFDFVKVFNEIPDEEWRAELKRLGYTLLSEREANSIKDTQGSSKPKASGLQGAVRKIHKKWR